MPHTRYDCDGGCPVEATLDLIGGKWKGMILHHLLGGELRFGELRRRLPGATARTVVKQLRELEQAGMIRRTVYPEVPPRVEYRLTGVGLSLRPVIVSLRVWGEAWLRAKGHGTPMTPKTAA